LRGSLNGTVFSRNRAGAYVRTKVSPVQPLSEFSTVARGIFGNIAKAWAGTLDQAQRDLWTQYAADHPYTNVFGDNIILSGIAIFQAINRSILQIGGALIEVPTDIVAGTALSAGATPAVTETANEIDEISGLVAATLGADEKLFVFATPPINPGRTPQRRQYRLLNQTSGTQPIIATDLFTYYNTRFGDPYATVGYQIGFIFRTIDPSTGSHGAPFQTVKLITAATP
jgi:hypothetical protein